MGDQFDTKDVPKYTNIEQWYQSAVDDACFWYGRADYSGTIKETNGVENTHHHFATFSEAEEWLMDNCRKWGPTLVVTYGDNGERLAGYKASS